MKKFYPVIFLLFIYSFSLKAQDNVFVDAPRQCWVALISEQEAGGGEYGWWSIWHEKKQSGKVFQTPVTFSNIRNGKYVLVVYDPASPNYDPNNGNTYEQSDGVVLKDISILNTNTFYSFNLSQGDFKEWNCLSCPWLYVYNGRDYVKLTEVLKDVVGVKSCKTDMIELPSSYIIDNKVKILIKEEKEEVTFIDGVSLVVNDREIFVNSDNHVELMSYDEEYLILRRNEFVTLEFELDEFVLTNEKVRLKVRGYYEPEKSFVMKYLNELK